MGKYNINIYFGYKSAADCIISAKILHIEAKNADYIGHLTQNPKFNN